MQEICSSNSPVVSGICDPNKSSARHHCSEKDIIWTSNYFPKPKSLGGNVKLELDLTNYATKADLKDEAGVDTLDFPKETDFANLKSYLGKLDIDKSKIIPYNLTHLKREVEKFGVDKLVPAPLDLSKLINALKNDIVKKNVYNAKIKKIEDKIPDDTNLPSNTTLNARITTKLPMLLLMLK